MHRCSPSTISAAATSKSSLDLLLLRQHRARAFFLQHRYRASAASPSAFRRGFSSTHGVTQIPATTLRFDGLSLGAQAGEVGLRRDEGAGLRITGYTADTPAGSSGEAIPLPLEEGDGKWRDDEEWCAEVQVVEPGDGEVVAQAHAQDAGKQADATEESVGEGKKKSRLARRQRRELAGSYKAASAKKGGQQDGLQQEEGGDEEARDKVLKMIEGMDGPAVQKKTERRKENKRQEGAQQGDKEASGKSTRSKEKDAKSAKQAGKDNKNTPDLPKPKRETWQIQKSANLKKFGTATWQPRKRLSPDTLEGIRALHASDPATYSTEVLSSQFAVSPENIRRILKSKWKPNDEEREDRTKRWERRGVRKWTEMAEAGERPPRRWREMGVGSVRGEPERRPAWKKGGGYQGDRNGGHGGYDGGYGGGGGDRRMWGEERVQDEVVWNGEQEFGERIL